MMKKIIIAILTSSILFLGGCETFFDSEPLGQYDDKNFYKNVNELQYALDGIYSILREKNYQAVYALIGDGMSDDFVYQYKIKPDDFGYAGLQLCRFEATTDNSWVREWYSINYRGILRANMLLKHVNDSIILRAFTDNGATDNDIRVWQSIYGQAYFLRALFYFNLVKSFGAVPIMAETPDYVKTNTPRFPVDSVYNYIEKDLRTAAVLLPIRNENGQASRFAALAYLMKVCIYQARPGVASEKWTDAKKIGKLLTDKIDRIVFTYKDILKPDVYFKDISWDQFKIKYKFNRRLLQNEMAQLQFDISKAIFQVNVSNGATEGPGIAGTHDFVDWGKMWRLSFQNLDVNREAIFIIPAIDVMGQSVSNNVTYIDQFYGNGTAFGPTNSLKGAINPSSNQEPRKYYGVCGHFFDGLGHPATEMGSHGSGGVTSEDNFIIFIKYFYNYASEKSGLRNVMLMRYSEVVLLYAEALNECGENNNAIDVLNTIRFNLSKSPSILADYPTNLGALNYQYGPYEYVREKVWHERRMELAGECDRFFDIVRQGRAETLINYANSIDGSWSKSGAYFVRGKNEILPIPQNEIDLSHGVITQNPGY